MEIPTYRSIQNRTKDGNWIVRTGSLLEGVKTNIDKPYQSRGSKELCKRNCHDAQGQRIEDHVSQIPRHIIHQDKRHQTSRHIEVVGQHTGGFSHPDKTQPSTRESCQHGQCECVKPLHVPVFVRSLAHVHRALNGHPEGLMLHRKGSLPQKKVHDHTKHGVGHTRVVVRLTLAYGC